MDVVSAIRARRTTKEYRSDPVPRDLIEQLIEAAAWAPNHHLTQPWRFTVLESAARVPLAELRRNLKARELTENGLPVAQIEQEAHDAAQKLLRAPYLIVISCHTKGNVIEQEEDLVATAAAIQNLLLTATSLGLGTFWTSGPIAQAPETKELLGLEPSDRILGIIHVGYPAESPGATRRVDVNSITRWVRPTDAPRLVAQVSKIAPIGNGLKVES